MWYLFLNVTAVIQVIIAVLILWRISSRWKQGKLFSIYGEGLDWTCVVVGIINLVVGIIRIGPMILW